MQVHKSETWRDIALAIQHENDSKKISTLVEDLCHALDDEYKHRGVSVGYPPEQTVPANDGSTRRKS